MSNNNWKNVIDDNINQHYHDADMIFKKALDNIIEYDINAIENKKINIFNNIGINENNIFYKDRCAKYLMEFTNKRINNYIDALKIYFIENHNNYKFIFDMNIYLYYDENIVKEFTSNFLYEYIYKKFKDYYAV